MSRNGHERLGLNDKSCGQIIKELFKIPYKLKSISNFLKRRQKVWRQSWSKKKDWRWCFGGTLKLLLEIKLFNKK